MMDLIFEYLIVFILLFVTNIAFLVKKSDFNKNKFIPFALIYEAIVFILSFICPNLNLGEYAIAFMPYILEMIGLYFMELFYLHLFQ